MDQIKIGKFIADCRKKANYTQMQLAEQLGITDRAVSKWETGKSLPDSSIMLNLCDTLGITVNDLLSGEVITMENEYPIGSVPVQVAAKVYGKDATWIRAGIIAGWLPIGVATRDGDRVTEVDKMDSKLGRINFYISPKKLYEETGYLWDGNK